MGRGSRKRHRSFEQDGEWQAPVKDKSLDVEVLIARDPNLPVDSDEEIDYGGGRPVVPSASALSLSRSGSGDRNRRDSHSSSASSNQKQQQQQRKKRNNNKKEQEKKNVNEDGVDNEEVFYVEKIKDKRWNYGRWEYLLAWQGYGPDADTWEPTSNMDCDDLLKEFEAVWAKKPKYGFDRGLTAREIVGLCLVKGKPMFLVLYKGSDDAEFVPREECTLRCPNLVIEFYEHRQLAKPNEDLIEETSKKQTPAAAPPVPAATAPNNAPVPMEVS